MSLFQQLSRPAASQVPQQGQRQLMDPRQKLQELQAHPAATLAQAGFNVPDNLTDAQQIINHLVQSGQVSPQLYNKAARMLGMPPMGSFGRR